ncbi:MAG TPA: peptidoglycan DD-metalloendopeptidase family protein [Candidatus Dojkabacteria bacterium]|nr:peptidoglycan DD-metalloendopeptidase family protein [Candidatus Dojkabacteria bacterium]
MVSENKGSSQNKNIPWLSFKDLGIPDEESDGSRSEDGYLFVDDDIKGNRFTKELRRKLHSFYISQSGKNSIIEFFISFTQYCYQRIRVILVLLSVLADLLFNLFNNVKDSFTKSMFWGRGNFLNSALKVIFSSVVFILTISYLYRKPVVTSASAQQIDSVGVFETDVMSVYSTANTLVPKNRARRSEDEYIVKGGDTLSSIAANYEGLSVESILWANDMDENSYIKPGDKLLIPRSNGVLVTVKSGDTIYSLAKEYSASDQAIADANWLDYPFDLSVGQQLFIPDGKKPTPVTTTYAATPSFYVGNQYRALSSSSVGDPNVGKFLTWPVAGGIGMISQYFSSYHTGMDIASNALPNIVAAGSGTVIFAGCNESCPPMGNTYGGSGYAWSIQIDHGNGYTTWYAHLKNIYVRSGQVVSRGEVIGQMGSTGRSTGPHVHFEVRRGAAYGTQVNPLLYLSL